MHPVAPSPDQSGDRFIPPSEQPGWYADPAGVWEYRWYDGSVWTDQVSRQGQVASDAESLHQALAAWVGTLATNGAVTPNRAVTPSGAAAQSPQPGPPSVVQTRKVHPFAVIVLVVFGCFAAFVGLGAFLVAIGWESDLPDEVGSEVAGAEIVDTYLNGNGTTTSWFVVVDEEVSDDELTRIATELAQSDEGIAAGDLSIEFFDDDGRELRRYIDSSIEFDQTPIDDLDTDDILDLLENSPVEWLDEHRVGYLSTTLDEGQPPIHSLCIGDDSSACDDGRLVPIG